VLLTIDSSVVVASLLAHDPRHREALVLMEQVLQGGMRAVMPCSVLVEVVAAIRRQTGSEQAALEVEETLLAAGGILFLDITRKTARDAARLAASIGVKGMDALVVQTALDHHAQLVSFDEEMLRKSRSVLA
jgi:predicted nucleic acid-binding protein